jgi:hypothetical protein
MSKHDHPRPLHPSFDLAERALSAYNPKFELDRDSVVLDLLVDLGHWCVDSGIDFEQCCAAAQGHVAHEQVYGTGE